MQHAIVEVRLNGSIQHTLTKPVSAAEIFILRAIHGDDAISFIGTHDAPKVSNADEIARLRRVYTAPVFAKVFPGSAPKLPSLLADAGIELPEVSKKTPKAE
ncbi:hypothetical protein UFOVP1325_3 [uncultured Caudovirales phage]|uniref:Uncharacterized protein n=1 Tax=uncultured Caudovirales phage TaxID=2100421 RepID=A0A6J7XDP6_9CAUD|nr:hypothetical protein UFOVP1325_3 [uncultured Caudovirales phage]CAB4212680.1 hypothetical protein UFOVP1435_27 [uncultured Caudovirales phage]CAB5227939.1 hypothetical protein UFOVP1530_17 [uncultured Caudovirales phage]